VARYNAPFSGYDKAIAVRVSPLKNVFVTGTSDGGSVVSTDSHFDYLTVKYDSMGVQQWVQRFNGYGDNNGDEARAMKIDDLENIYVTGKAANDIFDDDVATIKYNSAGTLLWSQFYSSPGSFPDEGNDIDVYSATSVYVTGEIYNSSAANSDLFLQKYLSDGTPAWRDSVNGNGNDNDAGNSITLGNNAVYVAGHTYYDGLRQKDYTTIKFDTTGAELWRMYMDRVVGITSVTDESPAEIYVDMYNSVYVTGYNGFDYGTVKYSQSAVGINEPNVLSELKIFPNPANEKLTFASSQEVISLKIYSILGEEIYSKEKINTGRFEIDLRKFPLGIYFISVLTGQKLITGKFMIQR
jgi:hypothetical protein